VRQPPFFFLSGCGWILRRKPRETIGRKPDWKTAALQDFIPLSGCAALFCKNSQAPSFFPQGKKAV